MRQVPIILITTLSLSGCGGLFVHAPDMHECFGISPYPNSEVQSSSVKYPPDTFNISSHGSYDSVVDFYRKQLTDGGWTIDEKRTKSYSDTEEFRTWLIASKGDRDIEVAVSMVTKRQDRLIDTTVRVGKAGELQPPEIKD